MKKKYKRCVRCLGQKKMYRIGHAYTHTNIGGVLTDCPLCHGSGLMPIITLVRGRGRPLKISGDTPS